jgi:hypothetical protein
MGTSAFKMSQLMRLDTSTGKNSRSDRMEPLTPVLRMSAQRPERLIDRVTPLNLETDHIAVRPQHKKTKSNDNFCHSRLE